MIDSMPRRRSSATTASPTGPAPSTIADSVVRHRCARHGVTTDRHRLGQRGAPVVEPVRHREAEARSEAHQVRVAAVVDVRVRADGLDTLRSQRDRQRRDQRSLAHRRPVGFRTERQHLRCELVTHDVVVRRIEHDRRAGFARRVDELVRVAQRVQVGSADAARLHRDERLTDPRNRVGNVLDDEVTPAGDRGEHCRTVRLVIAYVARMTAKSGRRDALLARLRELVDAAAAEPGTITFTMHTVDDDPDVVVSYELFADEAAFDAHRGSPTIARVLPQLRDLIAASAIERMEPVFGKGLALPS